MKRVSLIQQLWFLVVSAVVLAAAGSLVANLYNARDYLEQQLATQSADAANSLALLITQNHAEKAMGETLINAAFDQGHFRRITWLDPDGKPKIQRVNEVQFGGAPGWFRRVLPLNASPARAMISSGWMQAGVVEVVSDASYAYVSLWQGALTVSFWVLMAGVVVGLIGSVGVNTIRRQLLAVVDQAKAITQRRFVTIPEPEGPEMGRLAQAMNAMVTRVKVMFEEEAARLEEMRQQINFDKVTALANRDYFMGRLGATLGEPDVAQEMLVLIRIGALAELNAHLGRPLTDEMLAQFGRALRDTRRFGDDSIAARLNGADFTLMAQQSCVDADKVRELHDELAAQLSSFAGQPVLLAMAATDLRQGDSIRDVMSRLDAALALSEVNGSTRVEVAVGNVAKPLAITAEQWGGLLDRAVAERGFKLVRFAVRGSDGGMLHEEAPLRLKQGEDWLPAGQFLPMAIRTRRVAALDLAAVAMALEQLAAEPACAGLGVNLAAESLDDDGFIVQLATLIRGQRQAAARLWLEMAEAGIMPRFERFRALCLALEELPCRIGIEHFGRQFSLIGQLHDLGIDYLKVDGSFVQQIEQQSGNQTFLKGVCNIAHNIGLGVIAEGVKTEPEATMLFSLGFDAITGPGVK
ncbi:EAL domain-containing protein [Vogesella sp. LIG4]|uniref:bifunctional diguanylate cyclase/phosphodiesterase n=1 Tax=Vogesella sp. LIG4 TaxID=1192162 RepID=UPI00081F9D21|nr:EAL domain-containing protein [Vogesella sp. LIG4]SCK14196.1 diguanylate cyclase/phosphodiesterase [Vogesella sp. LIG4]